MKIHKSITRRRVTDAIKREMFEGATHGSMSVSRAATAQPLIRGGSVATRMFSVNGVEDRALCEPHKAARIAAGDRLGVPLRAAAYMFGLIKFPMGDEPCQDCQRGGAANGVSA